mmetsp:Transcript_20646/g.31486  ORF Transcript_20646/g.31486 Transcript_20646/m.31486 type:complete len:240 (+) Transcript_20646:434-1153(+)
MESQDGQTIYLLYTRHDFEQVGQYKITGSDCSSQMPFYFGPGTFSLRDGEAYQTLLLNYNGGSLSPYYMIYYFHNGFLDDSQFTIDNGYAYLKMKECPGATQNNHCRMHTLLRTANNNNLNIAGIESRTGGDLFLTVHHFQKTLAIRWSAYFPTGLNSATAGEDFPYFSRSCYTNQRIFYITSSATLGDATLSRIQSNYFYTPTEKHSLTIPFGTSGHTALDLYCVANTQVYIVMSLPT